MARTVDQLTALKVERAVKGNEPPGMYHDGGGLYLQVTKGGASWVLRYQLAGRARYMGLGPARDFGLADARARAQDARRLTHDGMDPIEVKRQARKRMLLEAAKAITFKDAAEKYIAAHAAGWTGEKVEALWKATLETYAAPVIGTLPVQAIDTALVMRVLEQKTKDKDGKVAGSLWEAKPETAGRVRQRIEAILDWAKVRGYRDGENPARWKGHLEQLLPARGKMRRVEHHAALPYAEIGAFMAALGQQEGVAARALEFAILTAARTGEVIGARWSEIDLGAKLWTVPAKRMKADKEHRVPLSARAVAILEDMQAKRGAAKGQDEGAASVFPGASREGSLSNMAFLMLLRRTGRDDVTAHGFRSTFRDWCAERTSYPREAAEMALAHTIGDKVEAAYRRGDLFDKRKRLMDEWSKFCGTPAAKPDGNVEPLRRA
jgi:integrase